MPPELQEQQIGHHGDGYRAFTALRRVGDLMLPEARASLQFFAEDRHGPPPAIDSNHLAGGHSGAIGHQDLRRGPPSITPFLTQHDEDSSTRPETRPVGIGPRGSTATGCLPGPPAAAIALLRHRGDTIVQAVSMVTTPGTGPGHHITLPASLEQLAV